MKKDKILPRKKSFKFIITNLFFIGLLAILYLSSNISIFTFGFLFDILFYIGLVSLIYFFIGNDFIKNIFFTIFGTIVTFLYNVDHIYYGMFSKFTSASSIANIDMVLDNFQSYEISIDSINVFMLSLLFIFILFLFIYKEDNKRFIERLRYFVPMLLIAVPFVVIYLLCYHDQLFLDLLLFPKRHKFPSFIDNFGYVFYRYEDIMVVIESLGG